MVIYVVKPNDTLFKISEKYGIGIDEIVDANQIDPKQTLVVGETLVIPKNSLKYVVKKGDTIYSIARNFGVSVDKILKDNPQITNPSTIFPGDELLLVDPNRKLKSIEVNGYVLPGIDYDVLLKTLPNLTYLSIFSYQVKEDGSFEAIDDSEIVSIARQNGVAPIMVITNIENKSGFSSELASKILNNEDAKNNLYQNILSALKEKQYYGLNIDFEYIYPSDREAYNAFVSELGNFLRENGFVLLTALAPKENENQRGLLYEAHDYRWHGEYVDRVILMTYEWGYLYGEPQAISPIQPIKRVLNYATSVIPSEKILLGMSNYGYDWSLPYIQGKPAQTLSNRGAVDLARKVGSFIEFDGKTQSPFFTYFTKTNKHIVWFDDARSYYSRLKLVDEYNLAGVSYWTLNQYYPQNWLVLNDLYDIVKLI